MGVKCGGSDTGSSLASNPSVGAAVDYLADQGATCIGGELFEVLGCEQLLAERAVDQNVADKILRLLKNEETRWCQCRDH